MKRIALCLYGLVGHEGREGKGKVIDYFLPYEFYDLNLKDESLQIDVFIHSWSYNYKNELIKLYKPTEYLFEKPRKEFGDIYGEMNFNAVSQLYTKKKTIELKLEYEKKNNFIYDWVFLSRFDICVKRKVNFNKLDNKKLYLVGPKKHHGKFCKCRFCDDLRIDHSINDTIYFSSTQNMDILSKCFDKIKIYYPEFQSDKIDVHIISKKHLSQTSLWNKVDYYFYSINNKYIYIWWLLQAIGVVPKDIVKGRVFDTDVPLVRWIKQKKFQKILDIVIFKGNIDIVYYYTFGWIHFFIQVIRKIFYQFNNRGLVKLLTLIRQKGIFKSLKGLFNN